MYLQLIWATLFDDLSNSKTDNIDNIYLIYIYIYDIRNIYMNEQACQFSKLESSTFDV